jgi:DnaJ-class molecular chaperone
MADARYPPELGSVLGSMAEESRQDHTTESEDEGVPCPPCRGTGKLISTSGGQAHEVSCPWCRGTGIWHRGIDAQAAEPKPDAGT